MPFIWSTGLLEPQEVMEDMDEIFTKMNTAGNNGWLFGKFTDSMGDPVIIQIPEAVKITVGA